MACGRLTRRSITRRSEARSRRVVTDLVSIVRYALNLTPELVAYPELVECALRRVGLRSRSQAGRAFNDEQLRWVEMIRDHIATALAMSEDDFDLRRRSPEYGGLGRAVQLFGDQLDPLLE